MPNARNVRCTQIEQYKETDGADLLSTSFALATLRLEQLNFFVVITKEEKLMITSAVLIEGVLRELQIR